MDIYHTKNRFILEPLTTRCHCVSTGASGRNDYLDVMMKNAEKYKKKMWG